MRRSAQFRINYNTGIRPLEVAACRVSQNGVVGERTRLRRQWLEETMAGTTDQFEGGCLCGAVHFIATGRPKGVYWCHCQSCRKHSGAPASVFVAFERTAYTVTQGEITKFDSTPGRTRRGFCARCGSTLTCESAGLPTETHFYVGAFDRAAELQPTRHVFAEEHLPWVPIG